MLQHRIDTVTSEAHSAKQVYKLKSTQTVNRNLHLYTEEQLNYIKEELKDFSAFFGYFNDSTTDVDFGFKQHNKRVLESLGLGGEREPFKKLNSFTMKGDGSYTMVADRMTPVSK